MMKRVALIALVTLLLIENSALQRLNEPGMPLPDFLNALRYSLPAGLHAAAILIAAMCNGAIIMMGMYSCIRTQRELKEYRAACATFSDRLARACMWCGWLPLLCYTFMGFNPGGSLSVTLYFLALMVSYTLLHHLRTHYLAALALTVVTVGLTIGMGPLLSPGHALTYFILGLCAAWSVVTMRYSRLSFQAGLNETRQTAILRRITAMKRWCIAPIVLLAALDTCTRESFSDLSGADRGNAALCCIIQITLLALIGSLMLGSRRGGNKIPRSAERNEGSENR